MTTVMNAVMPRVFDQRVHALVALLAALVAGVLLGPAEVAARPKGPG